MTVILETQNLQRSFGAVVAAHNINFQISEAEVVGVIGSNGAGKTTFVNMITGYLPPSGGEILYRGESIVGLATRDITRKGISRSFQIPQLFPELTVIDNILIALTIADTSNLAIFRPAIDFNLEKRAMELLKTFGIESHAYREITTLPQGIRKLIDIAMATVSRPDVLFLDEPTSGVSADEKMDLMNTLMHAFKTTETAVLFIEHDMEIIETFSPRVVAFYEGTILADGPTEDVLANKKVREYVIGSELHRSRTETTQRGED